MKKIWVLGLILVVFIAGCEFPSGTICIDHTDITVEKTGPNSVKFPAGSIRITIGDCSDVNENQDQTNTSQD